MDVFAMFQRGVTIHYIKSGSVKVFPMIISYNPGLRVATEAYIHPGCRGQLRAQWSGARFMMTGSSKKVEPKLGWPWSPDVL